MAVGFLGLGNHYFSQMWSKCLNMWF